MTSKVAILGIFFLLIGFAFTQPTLNSNEGSVFQFEENPEPGQCQVCEQMFAENQREASGYFRVAFPRIAELNATSGECCVAGGACPVGTGCNAHVINFNSPVFNVSSTSSEVYFDGNLKGGGGSQSTTCTPPGTTLICVHFQWEHVLNDGSTSVNYTIAPGAVLTIPPHTLRSTIKVFDWTFAGGSTGLRLVFQLMTRENTMKHFFLQPGRVDSATEVPGINTFTGISMEDSTGYESSVHFATKANIDGTAVDINILGLYPHEFDDNARYVYVDFPVSINSMEYSFYTSMDTLVGLGSSDLNFLEANKFYFIAAGCVLGLALICFFCCVVFCKVKRRDHHHHKHDEVECD